MHTPVYVRMDRWRGSAFWGSFWCWPITFIEWQHLLQVGWRSVRIGIASCWPGIIHIEVDIYSLNVQPSVATLDDNHGCIRLFVCLSVGTLQPPPRRLMGPATNHRACVLGVLVAGGFVLGSR